MVGSSFIPTKTLSIKKQENSKKNHASVEI